MHMEVALCSYPAHPFGKSRNGGGRAYVSQLNARACVSKYAKEHLDSYSRILERVIFV